MTTHSSRLFLARMGAATTLSLGIAVCPGGSGNGEIQLGAINPLSGSAAIFGELATETQSAWAEGVNDDGGLEVGGESREGNIVEYDDECLRTSATTRCWKPLSAWRT